VVQVYEVIEQPLPYLTMEFIPGETLQQRLDRKGPLEVAEIVNLARQIAEGLAAAHATDLIHRDIKPGNVLIEGGSTQRVKIFRERPLENRHAQTASRGSKTTSSGVYLV
jgi:eukaryotic-like serine/threonine-protein kinase